MHREMVNSGNGYARPEQLSALKTIWLRSFPTDTPEDVDAFFQSLFRPEDCLVHWENGQPVSMAFALPVVFHAADELYPVQYIYAASTLPEWRGRGIFGELLRFAFEQGAAQGMAASFLRPGEASLFGYYKRFGYRPFFSSEEIRLSRPVDRKLEENTLQVLAPEAYAAARGRALAHIPFHVEWSVDQAAYAVRNAAAAGGCALGRTAELAHYANRMVRCCGAGTDLSAGGGSRLFSCFSPPLPVLNGRFAAREKASSTACGSLSLPRGDAA